MASVLMIEDDVHIRELAVRALAAAGYAARSQSMGMPGLQSVIDDQPELVVLDLGLPDVDGEDLLRMIRAVSTVPVIVATARDDETDVIRLLNAGADDYVVKPYSAAHLEARVRALLRRAEAAGPDQVIEIGRLRIDVRSRQVRLDGSEVELNRKEFDLLAHLAGNQGVVVTRAELYAQVWREPYGGADKTIDVHLSWLRRKLGESAAEPRYLHTVRGVGIRLVDPEA
ncbi:MAG: response regulator transcription factor [Acidimicrobiia bacterium]|nr:response regulator transcription factor [Acidimicrobiia bacterium]